MGQTVIQNLVLGSVATNCMLVVNQVKKEMIIIDPADDAAMIAQAVTRFNAKPVAVLLTHGHFDHILAVDDVRDLFDIQVYAYEDERDILGDGQLNLSHGLRSAFQTKADILVKDTQKLNLAGIDITVFHTPGHTKGSCCYYLPEEKALISGDTLFAGSVGRMDFPTSSGAQMKRSIARLMKEIPEDVTVYPGHGETTTIGYEKRYNPFA